MPTNPPSARQPGEAPSECDFCGGDDFTPPSAHAFDRGNVYCIRCGGLHGRNYAPGVAEVVAFSDAAQRAFGPPAAREPGSTNSVSTGSSLGVPAADRTAEFTALLRRWQAFHDGEWPMPEWRAVFDKLREDTRAALATEER